MLTGCAARRDSSSPLPKGILSLARLFLIDACLRMCMKHKKQHRMMQRCSMQRIVLGSRVFDADLLLQKRSKECCAPAMS